MLFVITTSTCPSNKVSVTISRTTKNYANEESFTIYEGTSTSGTLVYTQPYVSEYNSYTWTVCLNEGWHVLELTDNYGDGWSSYSTVSLSIGSTSFGPYRCNGRSTSITFNIDVPVTSFEYDSSSVLAQKGVFFSMEPSFAGTVNEFSISSGSLPSGLSLSSSTGVISGIPTTTTTSKSVTIKATSDLNSLTFSLSFTVFQPSITCTSNEVLLVMQRVTKGSSSQEIFKIYRESTSGTLVYTQPTIADNSQYLWYVCLSKTLHVIEMNDSGNNGWSSGSNVVFYINGVTLDTYSLTSGSTGSVDFVVSPPSDLQYPLSVYVVNKNEQFSTTPTFSGGLVTFSVTSGTLPDGLELNGGTGTIYGSASSVTDNSAVTITVSNDFGLSTQTLSFSVVDNPSSCDNTKVLVTISRVTKGAASSEGFVIKKGSSEGTTVFTQPTLANNHNYTWHVCLENTKHTISMSDTGNNGWTTNSKVILSSTSGTLGTYRLAE